MAANTRRITRFGEINSSSRIGRFLLKDAAREDARAFLFKAAEVQEAEEPRRTPAWMGHRPLRPDLLAGPAAPPSAGARFRAGRRCSIRNPASRPATRR